MTSSKRNMTEFGAFPGRPSKSEGFYQFPTLYRIDGSGNIRQWTVFVRLVIDVAPAGAPAGTPSGVRHRKINWIMAAANQRAILSSYYTSRAPLPTGIISSTWSESGLQSGKKTRQIPTYHADVSNIGRANQRNQFQRALIYARNKYEQKRSQGYRRQDEPSLVPSNCRTDAAQVVAALATNKVTASALATSRAAMPRSTPSAAARPLAKPLTSQEAAAQMSGLIESDMRLYFPMLARKWKDYERKQARITKTLAKALAKNKKAPLPAAFPMLVQPKLNGNRCLAYLHIKDGGWQAVVLYSRGRKLFRSSQYLQKALYPFLNEHFDQYHRGSIYLDGEFYRHGDSLQDISGRARSSKTAKRKNEYHVYDCFYPGDIAHNAIAAADSPTGVAIPAFAGTPFIERHRRLELLHNAIEAATADAIPSNALLDAAFAAANPPGPKSKKISRKAMRALEAARQADWQTNPRASEPGNYVKRVPHVMIDTIAEAFDQFHVYRAAKYEGAMLRDLASPYLSDAGRSGDFLRSHGLAKMKALLDGEFTIVGYTQGTGKDAGCIIWVLETATGKQFRSKYKGRTYAEMQKKYDDVHAVKGVGYIGSQMSIVYAELSNAGTPQHSNAICIREYE